MSVRKLLGLTLISAVGFAMLRPWFGIGVFVLSFVPLAACLMIRTKISHKWLSTLAIILLSMPPWTASSGPFVLVQRTAWGHDVPPNWYRAGYRLNVPVQIVWFQYPDKRQYLNRYTETWQDAGFWLGRCIGFHESTKYHAAFIYAF